MHESVRTSAAQRHRLGALIRRKALLAQQGQARRQAGPPRRGRLKQCSGRKRSAVAAAAAAAETCPALAGVAAALSLALKRAVLEGRAMQEAGFLF